jgi:hypothetical protein
MAYLLGTQNGSPFTVALSHGKGRWIAGGFAGVAAHVSNRVRAVDERRSVEAERWRSEASEVVGGKRKR